MYDFFFSDSILFFQLSAIWFNKLYTNKLPFQSYNLSIAVPAALTGDTCHSGRTLSPSSSFALCLASLGRRSLSDLFFLLLSCFRKHGIICE